jgi:hypothetical protein
MEDWRGRREEKGRGGKDREERGWGGQGGEWGKELWRTTFECLPPRLNYIVTPQLVTFSSLLVTTGLGQVSAGSLRGNRQLTVRLG